MKPPTIGKKFKDDVSGIYDELNIDMMQNINNKIIEKSRIKKMQDGNANQFSTMQVASANFSI
jgi:hypothetical protein